MKFQPKISTKKMWNNWTWNAVRWGGWVTTVVAVPSFLWRRTRHQHFPSFPNFIIITTIIIIIATRPKPAFGRQGLAGSWGQDTDKVSNFWVFLTSHFAQLGIKPTWDHSWRYKSTWHHEDQTWSHNKNMKNQPGTMKPNLGPWNPTWDHEKPLKPT